MSLARAKISARTWVTSSCPSSAPDLSHALRVASPSAPLRSGVTKLVRWHVHGAAQIRRDQILGRSDPWRVEIFALPGFIRSLRDKYPAHFRAICSSVWIKPRLWEDLIGQDPTSPLSFLCVFASLREIFVSNLCHSLPVQSSLRLRLSAPA